MAVDLARPEVVVVVAQAARAREAVEAVPALNWVPTMSTAVGLEVAPLAALEAVVVVQVHQVDACPNLYFNLKLQACGLRLLPVLQEH